jgi:hypothetical protein
LTGGAVRRGLASRLGRGGGGDFSPGGLFIVNMCEVAYL